VLRQIRLLIFDLDYLVYDCAALKLRALRESLIPYADAIPHDVGLPDAADVEEGFRELGCRWTQSLQIGLDADRMAQLHSACCSHEERLADAGAGKLFSGVPELISYCHRSGAATVLGAEASREYLLAVSDRHGLDQLFDLAFCTEEFGSGREDEMLDEIMSRAQVHWSETLVLGTRPGSFRSARDLDLRTLGCGWGLQRREALEEADLQSRTLPDAYEAIRQADDLAARELGF
jgi:phosphoglycolate phosphatase-like HAD superfamily hydrolase